jgi:hypothetical protein
MPHSALVDNFESKESISLGQFIDRFAVDLYEFSPSICEESFDLSLSLRVVLSFSSARTYSQFRNLIGRLAMIHEPRGLTLHASFTPPAHLKVKHAGMPPSDFQEPVLNNVWCLHEGEMMTMAADFWEESRASRGSDMVRV